MKTLFRIFAIFACVAPCVAPAVTIKKAAPVATKSAATSGNSDPAGSLLPTVVGLVSGISQLNKQTRALSAECQPTAQEINFVDNTIKEWAKTGAATADEVETALRMKRCASPNGYATAARLNAAADGADICYDWYGDDEKNAVWYRFPKVGKTTYCTDGTLSCGLKEQKIASNIYEIFNLVDFGVNDYTASEATMAAKLLDKIEKCSSAKLSAKKRAMWGEFLIDTVGNMGQKTNTGAIMQQIQQTSGSGGLGALSSFGNIAAQVLNK